MTLDDAILQEAQSVRDQLLELRHQTERKQADLHDAIRRLHASGGSLREIADRLGLSHQRVHQIVDGGEPERRRLRRARRERGRRGVTDAFGRFSAPARTAVERAQSEARGLGHGYVGTEHLLIALADEPSVQQFFDELGGARAVRNRVREVVGEGAEHEDGPRRMTPRSKRALERSLEEAGEDEIEPRHLLLALARDRKGVAMEVLADLGCGGERAVRKALAP